MVDFEDNERWLFIIDTDNYAGNFERQLCAYCTGMVGDCGVGDDYAALWYDEEDPEDEDFFYEISWLCPDDHGCRRPVTMCDGPGDEDGSSSVAILFYCRPTGEHIEMMKRRALEFSKKKFDFDEFKADFNINGFRLLRQRTIYEEVSL
mgnify:CR=1 FL=1